MKLISTHKKSNLIKACIVAIFSIVLSHTLQAQVCSSPNTIIYGLDGAGNIYPINVTNASVGSVMNTAAYTTPLPNQSNALGYDNVNGFFYYFKVIPGAGTQQFISYNPATNTYTALASSPTSKAIRTGCVNFNGTGYYCADVNGSLYYYNIAANTWTAITSNIVDNSGNNVSTIIKSQGSGDMAIDGLGNLWMVTSNSSNWGLYKIQAPLPTTVQATVNVIQIIAPTSITPAGGNPFGGIAFNPSGQIYMSTSTQLYLLQNSTTLTFVGALTTTGAGDDLTSCSFPFSVLPVIWEDFSLALQSDKTVMLNWVVSQQVNNKGYEIEHSHDGKNWEAIGFKDDINSENASVTYSFTDANPFSGKNYYRIRQEDLNGNSSYSSIQMLDMEAKGTVAVWPNPAKDIVNIQQGNNTDVFNAEIFNQSGQKVSVSRLHSGINAVNIASLPAGFYIVHIDFSNGESYNQKLVKL